MLIDLSLLLITLINSHLSVALPLIMVLFTIGRIHINVLSISCLLGFNQLGYLTIFSNLMPFNRPYSSFIWNLQVSIGINSTHNSMVQTLCYARHLYLQSFN